MLDLRNLIGRLTATGAKCSFAQSGEDLIVDFIASAMGVAEMTYLDVGAHHPTFLSNTYFFYRKGCRGVLIEPDPQLYATLTSVRPKDVCVQAGIGIDGQRSAPFYVMSTRTLNTFSEVEARRLESMGTHRIERVLDIPTYSLQALVERHFPAAPPSFVSLDVEGMDFEVLKTLDLASTRPPIMCIETLTYSETRNETKDQRVSEWMDAHGYFVYADTFINTIFVDRARWKRT